MHKQGSTLIELLIVTTVFVVTMTLSIHLFSGLQKIACYLELTLLSVSIQEARQRALLTNTNQKITVNKDGSGYYSNYHKKHNFAPGISLTAPPGALGPPATPYTVIINPVTFLDNTIVCHKNGIINSGAVYLGDKKKGYFYALTTGITQFSFLRLYQYRLNWISL